MPDFFSRGEFLRDRKFLPPELGYFSVQFAGASIVLFIQRHAQHREFILQIPIARGVEEGERAIVFVVIDRLVRMGMTLHTAHRRRLPDLPGGVHAINRRRHAKLLVIRAALGVDLGVAMKCRRDLIRQRGVRQQISGELADGELIERQILIQGADDPITIRPDGAQRVFLITHRISIARRVQPRCRPTLAETRRREQAIHDFLVSLARLVGSKGAHRFGRRRQARQIKTHAAQPLRAVSFGRGLELLGIKPRENEMIKRLTRPF